MGLRNIVWGNLRRRKGKGALIVAGLTVAVAAFVLVLSLTLGLREAVDEKLSRYGSNLVVLPHNPELSLSYGGLRIGGVSGGPVEPLDFADVEAVRRVGAGGEVVAVIPVRLEAVETAGRRFLAAGTDLETSLETKPWWKIEGSVPGSADEVLVGLNVRNELGLEPGDRLELKGRGYHVAGVLWETGGEEDNLVLMEREVLDDLVGSAGKIDLIEVTTSSTESVDELQAAMERAVPGAEVRAVRQSIEFTNQANEALASFGLAVSALVAVIAGFVVMATMLTAIQERRKEIGVLRAVGYKQRHVGVLVVMEAVALSTIAAVTGVGAGLAGLALAPRIAGGLAVPFEIDLLVIAGGVAIAFLVGVGAALYPARRAANLDPATALRQV